MKELMDRLEGGSCVSASGYRTMDVAFSAIRNVNVCAIGKGAHWKIEGANNAAEI